MQTISITSKWQIHIPVAIRKKLGLKKPAQAKISVKDDVIVVKPQKSKILKMGGSLSAVKPTKPIDVDKIRDYIDYSEI